RHTSAGKSITIEGVHQMKNAKEYVRLQVKDEGQGIPLEDLPYVFERFYKADKARKRGSTLGTGLGLAIVKSFVELHDGQISVNSKMGQGTTFTLLFPVGEPQL